MNRRGNTTRTALIAVTVAGIALCAAPMVQGRAPQDQKPTWRVRRYTSVTTMFVEGADREFVAAKREVDKIVNDQARENEHKDEDAGFEPYATTEVFVPVLSSTDRGGGAGGTIRSTVWLRRQAAP